MPGAPLEKIEIVRLVKKYKKDGGHQNSKSVWFSLSDLMKIMALISSLDDTTNKKFGDGVRVYFAKYPNNFPDVSRQRKNTIVFVPTYNINGGQNHYDFIDQPEVESLSTQIGDPDEHPFKDNQGYDHGELCPEVCTGANVGNV